MPTLESKEQHIKQLLAQAKTVIWVQRRLELLQQTYPNPVNIVSKEKLL